MTYDGRAGAPGPTRLALADVEVLAARPPPGADAADVDGGLPRLLATLRVTVRQAVALTPRPRGGPAGAPAAPSGALKRRSRGHRSPV